MLDDVTRARSNAIFMEVRRRGDAYYLNSLEPPAEDPEWPPSFDALAYLIERAHARGIEVHAWFPVGPLWPFARPPVDPRHAWHAHGPHAAGDAMWMSVSSTGRVSTSVDLGHPDVQRYLADVMLHVARHYDVDGIHLDYVRYPEDADYGWNPKAVERFQRLANRTGPPSPADERWSGFRRRQVTEFVRQLYLRAYAIRPSIKISAALISWGNGPGSETAFFLTDAYRRVFQDWPRWLEEGILDLGIPMHYFREPANAAFLDRWLEFTKDRQYGRAMLIGLGVYLNSIPDSMVQLGRSLAPSAQGNVPLGVNFYSYASTNLLDPGGHPIQPNAEFYDAVGGYFGTPAAPPVLAWKKEPKAGHLHGWLTVDDGPAWLRDGARVGIESDTRPDAPPRMVTTDGNGFFGAVDLPPDRYRVRVERGGQELYRSVAQDIPAGAIARFDVFLKGDDFAAVVPRIRAAGKPAAAPGDILALDGAAFSATEAFARGLPLPLELDRTQVVVNDAAAPLFYISPRRIELQLPAEAAAEWWIVVRHDGMESAAFVLRAAF